MNNISSTSAPVITATHVTVGEFTAKIYGETIIGQANPAQIVATQERYRRVNQTSTGRAHNSAGIGL